MEERKAIHYGKVELIPGIICDVYILDDNTPVMSERGTADLLGVDHKLLNRMGTNWPPKTLKPFVDKGWSMGTNLVEVIAKNSPYKGRKIVTYDSLAIENLIRGYVLALANNKLRKNQKHIGERCAILSTSLIKTTVDAVIEQACGLTPNIQQTVQEQCITMMKQYGLKTSFPEEALYTKKDIITFLEKPLGTVSSYIKKHNIPHEKIDHQTIKANGGKANRMNGYNLEAVSKIVLGMDSVVGIELKKQIFGNVGTLVKADTKGEIEWQQVLAQVFEGFGFHHNYYIW